MSASEDSHDDKLTQTERFRQAAREIGVDEDETRWDERLRKVVKPKPQPEKPE